MEEWQAHIRDDTTGRAWCGVELGWEFAFQGPDHVARAVRRSRLRPCPACAEAVAKAVRVGWSPLRAAGATLDTEGPERQWH